MFLSKKMNSKKEFKLCQECLWSVWEKAIISLNKIEKKNIITIGWNKLVEGYKRFECVFA